MLFNDAMAIPKECNFKRKAIHDASRAEQKEMGDISCDDEEFERRMKADKEKEMAEYTNGDPEWKRRMNARVELGSHRRMERMRRTDKAWQQIEADEATRMRQADEEWKRLDKTLPHWIGKMERERPPWLCHICHCILPHPPWSTCPVACHGSLGDVHEIVMTSIEAADKAKFYCATCELDLNGAEDYAEHMAGKFHKNHLPNLPIANIAMHVHQDMMHVLDNGIYSSMRSSSSSSSK
jgi:hypothetical protein